eukprot:TRINITY_DN3764_c0_g1_i1.p1 TRINITY_DN3764_c0_g1~~TRINITY_DN3764_c0_g1_i1.p1  ORF type:complete len:318 (-),score=52.70 TRINITY_DN3764_c0_g1_i1:15-869(-)
MDVQQTQVLYKNILQKVQALSKTLGSTVDEILRCFPHISANPTYIPTPFGGSVASAIDHTLLKSNGTAQDIETLCEEAVQNQFFAICVNLSRLQQSIQALNRLQSNSDKPHRVKTAVVVGFPLGATSSASKAFETKEAVEAGADEIDMVLNIGKLIDGDLVYVLKDIKAVVEAANGKTVKVILETCLLNEWQIIEACILSVLAKANFVKTSTGFSTGGAKLEDVRLMKLVVGDQALVKASGGVKTFEDAQKMLKYAARIGTSSGVAIVKGSTGQNRGQTPASTY